MRKNIFLIISIFFFTLTLQGQEENNYEYEDSLLFRPKGSGELYLSLGFNTAVRSMSSYQPNALAIGVGVEMLPGNWAIGVGTRFSYINLTDKFFRNLYYPHLHIYGLYRAYNTDKGQVFAGISAELLTSVFYRETIVQQDNNSYIKKTGYQSFVCIGFRGMYKYPFLIGKNKNSKFVLSSFVEFSLPVYAYGIENSEVNPTLSYNDWLFRFGAHIGVRVGFGK